MLSSEPKRIDIPHESGQWMELRILSWRKIGKAKKKKLQEIAETQREAFKELGAEFMKTLQTPQENKEVDPARIKKLKELQAYDLDNFDIGTLLEKGIAAWSYSADVTPANIDELDERTAMWAAQQIIDMTKPPTEEEEKNSLPDSTTH